MRKASKIDDFSSHHPLVFRNGDVAQYLFWDFECTQEEKVGDKMVKWDGQTTNIGPIYRHKPNYAIVRRVCMGCKDFWMETCPSKCIGRTCETCISQKPKCPTCKEHRRVFRGEDCRDQFCDYLFREVNHGVTAIAHNQKGTTP